MTMKKAQSAMEYLMTYGWAILIVIIVAAALYALGIFNPATYTGRIPTGFTTLGAPDDWEVKDTGEFKMILNNRLAKQITVYEIAASLGSVTDTYDAFNCTGTASGGTNTYLDIPPGGNIDPEATCTNTVPGSADFSIDLGAPTAGTTYSVDVEILYNSGGFNHTETGKLTGTISS
jgi:hypothetical protein